MKAILSQSAPPGEDEGPDMEHRPRAQEIVRLLYNRTCYRKGYYLEGGEQVTWLHRSTIAKAGKSDGRINAVQPVNGFTNGNEKPPNSRVDIYPAACRRRQPDLGLTTASAIRVAASFSRTSPKSARATTISSVPSLASAATSAEVSTCPFSSRLPPADVG